MSTDLLSPARHWLVKYKLYHLPFWLVYHYGWWAVYTNSIWEPAQIILGTEQFWKYFAYVIFQAAGVYFNLYFLIPRLLKKRRFLPYLASLTLTIGITSACIVMGYQFTAFSAGESLSTVFNLDHNSLWRLFKTAALPSTIASMTLAMSIKLAKDWIALQQRQQLLEKEKLSTELKLLKSQFNPHFLFNTINSIFVLIHKNPDQASEALAKFSHLLRHQLYESNDAQIPLAHELTYLENYIELACLRQDQHISTQVDIRHEGAANFGIAPFLLISFLENAFKHVSQFPDQANWIKIQLHLHEQQLFFQVDNSIDTQRPQQQSVDQVGGIGLQNVARRLALLYPGQHELLIQKDQTHFEVSLRLTLAAYDLIPGVHQSLNPV